MPALIKFVHPDRVAEFKSLSFSKGDGGSSRGGDPTAQGYIPPNFSNMMGGPGAPPIMSSSPGETGGSSGLGAFIGGLVGGGASLVANGFGIPVPATLGAAGGSFLGSAIEGGLGGMFGKTA